MSLKNTWVLLTLVFISSCIELWGGDGIGLLRYDRTDILEGDLWRLATGHLVHGSHRHWFLNIVGLLLVWAIYPGYFRQPVTLVLAVGIAMLTSLALFTLNPDVAWYLGMSALLHGLFTAWSLVDLLGGRYIASVPLAVVVAKVLYEQFIGATTSMVAAIGLPVLVDAHLYGVIAGFGLGGILYKLGWLRVVCSAKKSAAIK